MSPDIRERNRLIMTTSRFPDPITYTINDACKVSGLGRTYLYQLISNGRLKSRKVGKRTLIPAESLRSLLTGQD